MIFFPNRLSRKEFLKRSAILAAGPAVLGGCTSAEIRMLEKSHPGVTPAQLRMVEYYSNPTYGGAPVSDLLLEFVTNLYSPEEAEIAQYLTMIFGRTARQVADRSGRDVKEVEAILSRLADEKRAIFVYPEDDNPGEYALMPVAPGTFELPLMEGKKGEYQRRHGKLWDELYNTGYITKLVKNNITALRYLPVEKTVSSVPNILPTDQVSEMFKAAKKFAVGFCQCRQSRVFAGKGCGKPIETCVLTDGMADYVIRRNMMRKIDMSEALDIKQMGIEAGLITMSINVQPGQANGFCSCCGCCCDVLRTITQFNTPGLIAPPHFRPERDEKLCVKCGACAKACPMGAHVLSDNGWEYKRERCVGCGLCLTKCTKNALAMNEVKDYSEPPSGYLSLILKLTPNYLKYRMFD